MRVVPCHVSHRNVVVSCRAVRTYVVPMSCHVPSGPLAISSYGLSCFAIRLKYLVFWSLIIAYLENVEMVVDSLLGQCL